MADNKQAPPAGNQNSGGGAKPAGKKDNVVALPGQCLAEECKQKSWKANFCAEHFDWFKEGLITKEGRRPTDFEKKLSDYNRRKKKVAAA